jgi:hypothetical protein
MPALGYIFILVGVISLAIAWWAIWAAYRCDSIDRMDRNGAILLGIVRATPRVVRALDTPEPVPFRVPAWIPRQDRAVAWVDRATPKEFAYGLT